MQQPEQDPVTQEFLREIRNSLRESITQQRAHFQQLFVIAGAIAAFSVPLYSSGSLSNLPHPLLALSIVSLLGCILIGVWRIGSLFTVELSGLRRMQWVMEASSRQEFEQRQAEYQRTKPRSTDPDMLSHFVYLLFSFGIVLLIATIVVSELRRDAITEPTPACDIPKAAPEE